MTDLSTTRRYLRNRDNPSPMRFQQTNQVGDARQDSNTFMGDSNERSAAINAMSSSVNTMGSNAATGTGNDLQSEGAFAVMRQHGGLGQQPRSHRFQTAGSDQATEGPMQNSISQDQIERDAKQFPGVIGGSIVHHHKINIFNKSNRRHNPAQNSLDSSSEDTFPIVKHAMRPASSSPAPPIPQHVPGTYDEFDGHTGMYLRSSRSSIAGGGHFPVSIQHHGIKE